VEIIDIFEESPLKFNRLEIVVHDPNTKQDIKQMVNLIEWNQPDQSISKIGAYLKLTKEQLKTEDKVKLSTKYQVLDYNTAMIAYEKIMSEQHIG